MKRLKYQLKNIRRDKLCILTFLLPLIAGLLINLLTGANLSSINEISFGIIEDNLPDDVEKWLQDNGNISIFEDMDNLRYAVNAPSTQMIGVIYSGKGLRTLLSGDELEMSRIIGNTLPLIYANRHSTSSYEKTVIPAATENDSLKSLLIVITMVTAMFMGCTFNAMNIISEKEEGIAFINQVLPLTASSYVKQKIALGFIGGTVSTFLTALLCMKMSGPGFLILLLLIILSAYIAALAGLFIGRFSSGLMSGIIYIKIIMILFLAPPVLFYLIIPAGSPFHIWSYILPSSATFYGLMDLLNGQVQNLSANLLALSAHCILWTLIYILLEKCRLCE